MRGMGEGEVWQYRQADAETLRRWEAWASEARTQLAAAGLPVQAEGLDSAVGAGAVVTVDPGADDAGGVYVGWHPAPVLRVAGMQAALRTDPRDPALRHKGLVDDAMTRAIREILTAGGFTMGESPNDLVGELLYVVGPPAEPLLERLGLDALRASGARQEGPAPSGEPGPRRTPLRPYALRRRNVSVRPSSVNGVP
ncbi:hypothetical protein GCM10010251_41380 [Streptomyces aurantiogriseus]|uniref:Uncharacterized protein n=2 Tax=Streptomyces aurantiogriseus TaxID=66870 RepID=A0A918CFE2_9ACTN|nr:hypothetical protein GCM10010251_41380 [Streptomyces aurantiogriseus]